MSELPQGWSQSTLAEVAKDISYGFTTSAADSEENPKLLRITDVQDYSVEWSDVPFCKDAPPDDKLLSSGDIVIARTGATTGKSYLLSDIPTETAFASYLIRVRSSDAVDPEYLWKFMWSPDYWRQITVVSKGTAQPGANASILGSLELPIPPLLEQRRIVAKLDRLSTRSAAARDHLTRTTKLATRAKQAILAQAFDGRLTKEWRSASGAQFPWAQECIGEISHIITGNTPPTKNKANYGDEHPFVKPGDLDKGAIYATESHLSSDGYSIARQLPIDTVLVSCIGNLGKIGILARNGSCNQQINALLPSADLLPRFTYWWAHTIRSWLEENASATTVSIINKGRFSLAPISVPCMEEQAEIVRRIEAAFARIDRLTEEASRAAHLLDRLDERLLAKAFRGELVPQDPDDEPAEALLTRIREARAAAPKAKRGRRKKAEA